MCFLRRHRDAHAGFHPHVEIEAKPSVVPDGFGYGPRWQGRICDSHWQGKEAAGEICAATRLEDMSKAAPPELAR